MRLPSRASSAPSNQQHRAHRHFPAQSGGFRFFQRQCYGFGIVHIQE